VARQGLVSAGVEPAEADEMLGIIQARVEARRTGAGWQRQVLARLEEKMPRVDALAALLERYRKHAETGAPVHTWPVE
jgi:hypothetical protein